MERRELTWEDMRLIDRILEKMIDDDDINGKQPAEMTDEEYYTEALKRFKDANKSALYIPSVWREEDIKKAPSKIAWASIGDDGEYRHGEKYYDADLNEITKEEYEALVGPTQD